MTKVADSKRIMKAYYGNHNASKADVALIESYLARSSEERTATRAAFRRWFEAQARIREILHKGGEGYFYPAFAPFIDDYDAFLAYATKRRARIMKTIEEIRRDFSENASDEILVEHLKSYIQDLNDFLDHDESITVPVLLEHFTAASYEKLASDYGKKLAISEALLVLPWMASRLPSEDKADVIGLLPFPVRLLYRLQVEPRFRKLMQF